MNIIAKKEDENIREKNVNPKIWTQTSKGLIRRNNTNLIVSLKEVDNIKEKQINL